MSRTSRQPIGARVKSPSNQFTWLAPPLLAWSTAASRRSMSASAHDVHHLGHRMHPNHVRTGQHGCGDGRCRPPVARGWRALAGGALQERLSRGTDEERTTERVQLFETREERAAVLRAFREADPRIDEHVRHRDAGLTGVLETLAELRAHLTHDVVVVCVAVHGARSPARVHEAHGGARARDDARQRGDHT